MMSGAKGASAPFRTHDIVFELAQKHYIMCPKKARSALPPTPLTPFIRGIQDAEALIIEFVNQIVYDVTMVFVMKPQGRRKAW